MKPQITVGICVKNSQSTIREAIKSILKQDYPPDLLEVIVVDGLSKDATLSIVSDLLSQSGVRWRIYSDRGKGLGFARQSVVKHARGRYIIFVDADAVIRNDFFRRQIAFMKLHRRVAIGLGRQMYKEGERGSWFSNAWRLYSATGSGSSGGCGSTWFCRTDALRSVGGFDVKIIGAGEDLDIIARLQPNGWSTARNENAEYFHNSQQTLKGFWSHQNWYGYGEYYFARKHPGSLRPRRILPPGPLIHGLREGSKAYRSSRYKISFLILPLLIFGSMAWWCGFIRAAIHRYGRPS